MQKPNAPAPRDAAQALSAEGTVSKEQSFAPSVEAESDREFKAHIHQQLVDLQPYLSGSSQVAVIVQMADQDGDVIEVSSAARPTEDEAAVYLVTLSASLGDARVESHGHDADLYSAFGKAKEALVSHLAEWTESEQDAQERETQIRAFADGSGIGARLIH